ncbi:MAG: outer membrane lipoprotein-sorting protein [Proteobacteria bacterium]|nr:outer membrane lipoprotein-sorting protein [Pseudomonadota bacterium]
MIRKSTSLFRVWGLFASIAVIPVTASAISPDSSDPNEIIQAVDARDGGDRSKGRIVMTIRDDDGRTIERTLQTRAMSFESGTKTLFIIEAPEDVRDTGLLSIDYDKGAKADDQWLYLPSLRRVTRIASSGKSGAFLGSDLTYADLTKSDTEDFNFTLVEQAVDVDGEACWLLEAVPKVERVAQETGYVKTHYWISKEKLIPVQAKHWVAEGRKLKYMKFAEMTEVDGIWTAKRIAVRVVRGGEVESETVMQTDWIHYDQEDVVPADFTERRLERGI